MGGGAGARESEGFTNENFSEPTRLNKGLILIHPSPSPVDVLKIWGGGLEIKL